MAVGLDENFTAATGPTGLAIAFGVLSTRSWGDSRAEAAVFGKAELTLLRAGVEGGAPPSVLFVGECGLAIPFDRPLLRLSFGIAVWPMEEEGLEDGRERTLGVDTIGLCGLKKLDLRLDIAAGDGGKLDRLSTVLSDNDSRGGCFGWWFKFGTGDVAMLADRSVDPSLSSWLSVI